MWRAVSVLTIFLRQGERAMRQTPKVCDRTGMAVAGWGAYQRPVPECNPEPTMLADGGARRLAFAN